MNSTDTRCSSLASFGMLRVFPAALVPACSANPAHETEPDDLAVRKGGEARRSSAYSIERAVLASCVGCVASVSHESRRPSSGFQPRRYTVRLRLTDASISAAAESDSGRVSSRPTNVCRPNVTLSDWQTYLARRKTTSPIFLFTINPSVEPKSPFIRSMVMSERTREEIDGRRLGTLC